jgi:tripartite-type tricarboxylate transporter receptor subunit TctC
LIDNIAIGEEAKMKFTTLAALGLGLALQSLAPAAIAQVYPSRPVRIIVPYGTGGGSDVLARQIGAELQAMWGQGVAVENRAGASGNIGTEAVVHAAPDGHTLLLQNSTMVVNQAVSGKLNYDPEKDLTPIMLLGVTPIALVAHPSLGVKNLKDLVAYGKAHPKTLAYGSCGIGTPQHFVMELVKQKTGIDASHAGYKGCAPGLTDVVGGQIPLAILSANLVAPYVASGRLVGVGVSTRARYKLLPDTPTFEEQGLKPLDFSIWYALMGPARLPPEVVARVYADVQKILAQPDTQSKLSKAGVEPLNGNGAELATLIREDAVRYMQLAKSANIKAE